MSLKRDIVIVNEYTTPLPSGGGSRGGTPGDYVTRYMAREGATETVAPIRHLRVDDFLVRYMAREGATESTDILNPRSLKRSMAKAQGRGGVGFGYGSASLSHEEFDQASADVQQLFENDHTVMKTVMSFSHDFLLRHGLVREDFVCERKGDYRGELDQMKLRMAIMHGLERMGRDAYDDLRYVGVIQVDTEHVHCHLAMVDAGVGTVMPEGTQRGKVGDRSKSLLRRGTDAWLDGKQRVAHLSSAVGYDRRNVTTYVKRWAHKQMLQESLPQFLIACLPADRRMWRLSTNNEAMEKPNRLVTSLVEKVLARDGSPMEAAMASVHEYADERREVEGMDEEQWQGLVATGRRQIVERGANAVYASLRQLPDDALEVRTPILDVMSMDLSELQEKALRSDGAQDDIVGFGFRLRSYSSRLEHHTEKREEYHDLARGWEASEQAGMASANSRVLHMFYLEEEEYHARVMSKYRSFLDFAPPDIPWQGSWEKVVDYGERMLSLESMRRDQSLRKTKDPDEAERIGHEVYGQRGGHLVSLGDKGSLSSLDDRITSMRQEYGRRMDDFRTELSSSGLRLDLVEDGSGHVEPRVTSGPEHPFEEVKGLDMHNMLYDFADDVEVGARALAGFTQWARRRQVALQGARAYLESTGQRDLVESLPVADVAAMGRLAARMVPLEDGTATLPSEAREIVNRRNAVRRSATIRLSTRLSQDLEHTVQEAALEPWELPMPAPMQELT